MNTFEIARQTNRLPTKLEDVVKFLFVGEPGLAWGRKALQQMRSAGVVSKEHETLNEEAKRLGELVLDAYVRLGELLPPAEKSNKLSGENRAHRGDRCAGYLPEGVDPDKAYLARKLAKNPEAVAEIKRQAAKNDDIATKTAVLTRLLDYTEIVEQIEEDDDEEK